MAVHKTLESMGLRANKSVAGHLLVENAYESNLIPDISQVNYLAGHQGRTNLQPLEGLPPFVDDIYVFGYLLHEDIVVVDGHVSCTTGDDGSACKLMRRISMAVQETIGKRRGQMQANILHTVSKKTSGAILSTIHRIEQDTKAEARKAWCKRVLGREDAKETLMQQNEIAAVFVAKVDASAIPMEELQKDLPAFARELLAVGYGIYSIDYTQDFSGVLDRPALVRHLVEHYEMREQGDLAKAMCSNQNTILDNTDSVGKHVCTYVYTRPGGYTVRTKLYNKIVSNFEAGTVREKIGGHLADYADCPNKHLRKTFFHPDVQERGLTRIEVSLYACRPGIELSENTAMDVISHALNMIHTREGLFVIQPPAKQWENLANELDRCLVLADRPMGVIYMAWYAHTTTKRVAGVCISPTKAVVECDDKWDRAVRWAASDFGFRACPIFRADIESLGEEGVNLGPLICYSKDSSTKTILAASKRPTQVHNSESVDLADLLPPTKHVEWMWRTKKMQRIGVELVRYNLHVIHTSRTISTLSTRERERKLLAIEKARAEEQWRYLFASEQENKIQQRAEEVRRLEILVRMKEAYDELSAFTQEQVQNALTQLTTESVSSLCGKYEIRGYRSRAHHHPERMLSSGIRVVVYGADGIQVVWSTKGLDKVLEKFSHLFLETDDKYGRKMYWFVSNDGLTLEIEVGPPKSFWNGTKMITYNNIRVVNPPSAEKLQDLQEELAKADCAQESLKTMHSNLLCIQAPKPQACKKAVDMDVGNYICTRFARATFRGTQRTIYFLCMCDEKFNPIL